MSAYSDVRKRMAEQKAGGDGHACNGCGDGASKETLSSFGGNCFRCYLAYCREPIPAPERSPYAQAVRQQIAAARKGLPR